MTIEKHFPSGALVISEVVGGQRVTRIYQGYSRREAAARFRQEIKSNKAR